MPHRHAIHRPAASIRALLFGVHGDNSLPLRLLLTRCTNECPGSTPTPEFSFCPHTVDAMRILLTGASGFIGSHVLEELAPHDVVAVTRTPLISNPNTYVTNVVAELSDERALRTALQGCDVVVHLAAVSTASDAAADPARCIDVNVTATVRLAHLAAAEGVPRFVFASSALVYGSPPVLPITEHTPVAAAGAYAISKFAAEQLLQELVPSLIVLRVFNVFGPRQCGALVPTLIERIKNGDPVVLQGDGTQVRSFLFVKDAARAVTTAAASSFQGTLNIAGERASVLAVVAAVEQACARSVELVFGPARPGDPKENWGSSAMAEARLGWTPRTSLQEGITLTVRALTS